MIPFAIIFLVVVAIALVVVRNRLAPMQAMVMGGHMGPGCVTAEAATLLVIALLIFLFREQL